MFGITSKDIPKGEWKEVALPDKNVKVCNVKYIVYCTYSPLHMCMYLLVSGVSLPSSLNGQFSIYTCIYMYIHVYTYIMFIVCTSS